MTLHNLYIAWLPHNWWLSTVHWSLDPCVRLSVYWSLILYSINIPSYNPPTSYSDFPEVIQQATDSSVSQQGQGNYLSTAKQLNGLKLDSLFIIFCPCVLLGLHPLHSLAMGNGKSKEETVKEKAGHRGDARRRRRRSVGNSNPTHQPSQRLKPIRLSFNLQIRRNSESEHTFLPPFEFKV